MPSWSLMVPYALLTSVARLAQGVIEVGPALLLRRDQLRHVFLHDGIDAADGLILVPVGNADPLVIQHVMRRCCR